MLILVPFKPVAIVLGCLSAMIFCGYFINCWIEHKDPFKADAATHINVPTTATYAAPAYKHTYRPAAHVSQ
jgi:hypothetical protein